MGFEAVVFVDVGCQDLDNVCWGYSCSVELDASGVRIVDLPHAGGGYQVNELRFFGRVSNIEEPCHVNTLV